MLRIFRISFIKTHWHTYVCAFLLLVIVLIGGALRTNSALQCLDFGGDPGRDALVARHIALYHEFPQVGHSASGVFPNFYYPPYYYYGLGALYSLVPNVSFLSVFLAIIQTLSIVAVYFIGKLLGNKLMGLLSAGLFALSAPIVWNSNCITAVYFGAPLFWVSYVLLLLSVRRGMQRPLFMLSLFILLLSSTITYSSLVFLPYFLCIPFIKHRYSFWAMACYGVFSFVVFLLLYSPLILYFGTGFWSYFSPANAISADQNFIKNVFSIIAILQQNLFWKHAPLLFVSAVFYILVIIKNHRNFRSILWVVMPPVYLILVASVKHGPVFDHYFTILYPFIFIVLVYPIVVFWKNHKKVGYLLFIVIALGLLLDCVSAEFSYFSNAADNDMLLTEMVAKTVLQEAKNLSRGTASQNTYKVIISMGDNESWTSSSVLYSLETLTHRRYVKIVNGGESFEQTGGDEYIFWICEDFYSEKKNKICYNTFIRSKKDYSVIKEFSFQTPRYYGYVLQRK